MVEAGMQRRVEAIWRMESAKLIAKLARMLRDVGLAEELAQDVFVTALEQWPTKGLPDNPGAWLMTTAKHRAIDRLRQQQLHASLQPEISHTLDAQLQAAQLDLEARDGRRHWRRPAAPDFHCLPPGALHRGAHRADAAPVGRPDHR